MASNFLAANWGLFVPSQHLQSDVGFSALFSSKGAMYMKTGPDMTGIPGAKYPVLVVVFLLRCGMKSENLPGYSRL